MQMYPELPGPRTRQLAADASVAGVLVLFALFGWLVRTAVNSLRVISDAVTSVTDGVHGTWSSAADVFSSVPLVGDRIQQMLAALADGTAGNAADLGRSISSTITATANVLGLVTFAVPTALILVFWLPVRIRKAQRWDAAQRVLGPVPAPALTAGAGAGAPDADAPTLVVRVAPPTHLLAMRALCQLPLADLVKFEPRPFEAYAEGRYAGLVAALYDYEGLRPIT